MKRETKERRAVARVAQNILAVYLDADDFTRAAGRVWYAEESERLREFAQRHDIGHANACGAAAAISPGMRWEFVVPHLAALRINPLHKVPTYSKEFVRRASMCLRGADPLSVLSGPKVTAFYALLARPDVSGPVVIDGHALNIANGLLGNIRGDAVPAAGRVTAARYRRAAAAYREVAELVGETAHAVQAATWIHWRNLIGEKA